jgi:hypothetical protein
MKRVRCSHPLAALFSLISEKIDHNINVTKVNWMPLKMQSFFNLKRKKERKVSFNF